MLKNNYLSEASNNPYFRYTAYKVSSIDNDSMEIVPDDFT